jgi:large subunit ribosomal protein L14
MQAVSAKVTKGLLVGTEVATCDNSGAKRVRIFTVVGSKTVKRRVSAAGVGDLVQVSVKKGKPEMRKQVVYAVVVRQKKEYKRANGMRIKFEDNAVVVLKDEKGNPKGTAFKGAIAKEAASRWPAIAKVASVIV